MLNPDFKDMLSAFIDGGVEFLLVGGHAMAAHGLPRFTRDIDLWVRPTPENVDRVYRALEIFGAPMMHVSQDDLFNNKRAAGRKQDLLDAEKLDQFKR